MNLKTNLQIKANVESNRRKIKLYGKNNQIISDIDLGQHRKIGIPYRPKRSNITQFTFTAVETDNRGNWLAICEDGTYLSKDNGINFNKISSETGSFGIYIIMDVNDWYVMFHNRCLFSNNLGESWELFNFSFVTTGTNPTLQMIETDYKGTFIANTQGFNSGYFRSIDKCRSWTRVVEGGSGNQTNIVTDRKGKWIANRGGQNILLSENNGLTFETIVAPTNANNLAMNSHGDCVITAGDSPCGISTSSDGRNWVRNEQFQWCSFRGFFGRYLNSMAIDDNGNCVVVAGAATETRGFLISSDFGKTWERITRIPSIGQFGYTNVKFYQNIVVAGRQQFNNFVVSQDFGRTWEFLHIPGISQAFNVSSDGSWVFSSNGTGLWYFN